MLKEDVMPSNLVPSRRSSNYPWRLRFVLVLVAARMVMTGSMLAQQNASLTLLATLGPKEQAGAWSVPALPAESDRMQAVHATLLPNGKILIFNGSSLRLQTDRVRGFRLVNTKSYEVTNNTGVYDPGVYHGETRSTASTFTRIDSPPNPVDRKANDLFCGGHLQTPDGDVLVVSGTDNYYSPPFQYWTGSVFANLYDWQTGTWKAGGKLKDGHWYPTLLPLADGRIAAISGWSSEQNTTGGVPVSSRMSTWVEIYDWTRPVDSAWQAVDIKNLPNSPFTDRRGLDHYPRIHALQDGRFLIAGDGSGGGSKDIRESYFMTIAPGVTAGAVPNISFEMAAERASPRRIYGTAVVDPNSPRGDVLLIGGQLATEVAMIGPTNPPQDLAEAVTSQMERFTPPTAENPLGRWEVVPDFIGDRPTDARSNHYALLLPTKQLLIMGGGRYRFYRPNFQPLLLTPDASAPGGYQRVAMNPGTQPRLYHNTALLLPDGRIFVAGGNASYAARHRGFLGGDTVRLNTRIETGMIPLDYVEDGTYAIPAEIYQTEFFYPPYLFSPGPRPEITAAPTTITYGASHTLSVSHMTPTASLVLIKLGAVTHGWDQGQRLADLDFSQDLASGEVTFEAPTASDRHLSPPAYYMIFYVNGVGYPSVAKIVQLKI